MSQYGRITTFLILLGFLALLFAGLSAPLTYAQTPEQQGVIVRLNPVYHRGGGIGNLFVTEQYIYTNFGIEFAILERVNETTYRRVGYTLMEGNDTKSYKLYVDGNYAYVFSSSNHFHVIDVSDPANPTVVAEIGPMYKYDMVVANGYAYLVGDTLDIIDVSQPAQPTLVCTRCGAEHGVDVMGHDAALQDSLLYTGDTGGLNIYDVSDPTNVVRLGRYELEDYPDIRDLSVRGNLAYMTTDQGFEIIDISNPAAPTRVGFTTDQVGEGFIIDGPYAYVRADQNQLWIIDIRSPSTPRTASLTGLPDAYPPLQVAPKKVGDQLYLGVESNRWGGYEGIMVLDVSDPTAPAPVTTVDTYTAPLNPGRINSKAPYLYVENDDRVYEQNSNLIFDVSHPENARLVGTYEGDIRLIQGAYGYGFGFGESGAADEFQILDLSEPLTPTVTGTYTMTNHIIDFAVVSNHAYLSSDAWPCSSDCAPQGLQILDISDPTQPKEVSFIPDFSPRDFVVRGNYLFDTFEDTFFVYDISDPPNVREVGTHTLPSSIHDFNLKNNFAFIATGSGLRIIDLQDLTNPVEVGNYPVDAASVHVSNRYAYLVTTRTLKFEWPLKNDTIHVVDITDVKNPMPVGEYTSPHFWGFSRGTGPGDISGIAMEKDHIYFSAQGLFILQQQDIEAPYRYYLPTASRR